MLSAVLLLIQRVLITLLRIFPQRSLLRLEADFAPLYNSPHFQWGFLLFDRFGDCVEV